MYTKCCSIKINASFMSLSKPKHLQNIATRLLKVFTTDHVNGKEK